MKKNHELKLNTEYFGRVQSGQKPFEIRKNDRDYQVGDTVTFLEFMPETREYTNYGGSFTRRISYLTTSGQKEGYVVFAVEEIADDE